MWSKIKGLIAKATMVYTLAMNLFSDVRDIIGGLKKSVSRKQSKASKPKDE